MLPMTVHVFPLFADLTLPHWLPSPLPYEACVLPVMAHLGSGHQRNRPELRH